VDRVGVNFFCDDFGEVLSVGMSESTMRQTVGLCEVL
jgi:hypothetical protein